MQLFFCIFGLTVLLNENLFAHLPESKQKEIQDIFQIIIEEADPDKVILFGSHATNDWVEDEYKEDGINFSYLSDYDF